MAVRAIRSYSYLRKCCMMMMMLNMKPVTSVSQIAGMSRFKKIVNMKNSRIIPTSIFRIIVMPEKRKIVMKCLDGWVDPLATHPAVSIWIGEIWTLIPASKFLWVYVMEIAVIRNVWN
jgi:hypothetical protein